MKFTLNFIFVRAKPSFSLLNILFVDENQFETSVSRKRKLVSQTIQTTYSGGMQFWF